MNIENRKFKPGDRVCYRPNGFEDEPTYWEYGKVVRNGSSNLVFVIYDQDRNPKATYENNLYFEFETLRK